MYEVLYDQAGRLSVDKRVSTKQLKNNYNDIHPNISKVLINEGSMFDYENIIL